MTHFGMTAFLLALLFLVAFAVWVYTHRSHIRLIQVTKMFDPSRARQKLFSPPLFIIQLREGVFLPDNIHVYVNKKYRFRFIRRDPSPSAADIYIPYFHQQLHLEMGKPVEIDLVFKEIGQFLYTCSNGLYKGWIIVTH